MFFIFRGTIAVNMNLRDQGHVACIVKKLYGDEEGEYK